MYYLQVVAKKLVSKCDHKLQTEHGAPEERYFQPARMFGHFCSFAHADETTKKGQSVSQPPLMLRGPCGYYAYISTWYLLESYYRVQKSIGRRYSRAIKSQDTLLPHDSPRNQGGGNDSARGADYTTYIL